MLKPAIASVLIGILCAIGMARPAQALEYLKDEAGQHFGYSPAVLTKGGTIVWMGGQFALKDDQGNSIAEDVEAQTRHIFKLMDETLRKLGGTLQKNLVLMTVTMNDPRYGDKFFKVRKEVFPDGNYPASQALTISNFAIPGMKIEIQGMAVLNDDCSTERPCLKK
ncbi:MAG: RidA family protein [Nitrospira sp.]|nr:RidA family protein [Nitrospira sp.]